MPSVCQREDKVPTSCPSSQLENGPHVQHCLTLGSPKNRQRLFSRSCSACSSIPPMVAENSAGAEARKETTEVAAVGGGGDNLLGCQGALMASQEETKGTRVHRTSRSNGNGYRGRQPCLNCASLLGGRGEGGKEHTRPLLLPRRVSPGAPELCGWAHIVQRPCIRSCSAWQALPLSHPHQPLQS